MANSLKQQIEGMSPEKIEQKKLENLVLIREAAQSINKMVKLFYWSAIISFVIYLLLVVFS